MERLTIYEELRLIERSETEVSSAWKGAHLLLFFLAFVFGSFCTFCFNMLMYLFDEKCVLFPKIISLTSLRNNAIYEFLPQPQKKTYEPLPVDFLSTQFVHKSACYLPTYVPLVSGIFGLVWTTMFLMCSSGSRSLSGLHRPWRVIVPVLVFSVAMSALCIYASVITHTGLTDLCVKLGEITGSPSCSYTINVATLTYGRQIRGVYQATRLTITSAWMHTACWIASAILAIVRILMAVDFRLVKIRAELIGDMDRMLEQNEEHLHTVMPTRYRDDDSKDSGSPEFSYFEKETDMNIDDYGQLIQSGSDVLFISNQTSADSDHGLVSDVMKKSSDLAIYKEVPEEHRFIVLMIHNILDSIEYDTTSSSSNMSSSSTQIIGRQLGQEAIPLQIQDEALKVPKAELYEYMKMILMKKIELQPDNIPAESNDTATPSTSKKRGQTSMDRDFDMKQLLQNMEKRKSSLKGSVKDAAAQTEKKKKSKKKHKVTIADLKETFNEDRDRSSSESKKDEGTQTKRKEKQD